MLLIDPNTILNTPDLYWICTICRFLSSNSTVIVDNGVFYEKFPLLSLSKGNVPVIYESFKGSPRQKSLQTFFSPTP